MQQVSKTWITSSRLGLEKKLMHQIANEILGRQMDEPRIDDILTCVAEAYLNAVEHGNSLQEEQQIIIVLTIGVDKYVLQIFDQGQGFTYAPGQVQMIEKLRDDNPRGWGLFLIQELADDLSTGFEKGTFYLQIEFRRMKGRQQNESVSCSY